ncbi:MULTISPECIES: hypothetical protein [unclassified Rickettsia]
MFNLSDVIPAQHRPRWDIGIVIARRQCPRGWLKSLKTCHTVA